MTKSRSPLIARAALAERRQHPADHVERFAGAHFERGAEDARQVADVLGDEEIALHQPLDAEHAGAIEEAEALRELRLQIEGQLVVGAAGEEVQRAADRPEEILGALEQAILIGRQHALVDELGAGPDAVEVLADPEQRIEVAQTALAVLDVGLDDVARVAHLAVALFALGHFRRDELGAGLGHDLGLEPLLELVEQRSVAGEVPRLERRGPYRHVRLRHPQALVDRAHRVADLLAEVPEHIEDVLGDLLAPGRLLVGQDEEEIDVRARRKRAAAIATDGSNRDRLGARWVVDRIDLARRKNVDRADQFVLGSGEVLRATEALARRHQFGLGRLSRGAQGLPQHRKQRGAAGRSLRLVVADGGLRLREDGLGGRQVEQRFPGTDFSFDELHRLPS